MRQATRTRVDMVGLKENRRNRSVTVGRSAAAEHSAVRRAASQACDGCEADLFSLGLLFLLGLSTSLATIAEVTEGDGSDGAAEVEPASIVMAGSRVEAGEASMEERTAGRVSLLDSGTRYATRAKAATVGCEQRL